MATRDECAETIRVLGAAFELRSVSSWRPNSRGDRYGRVYLDVTPPPTEPADPKGATR
jgi:hypothetical protein